jgi:hypothetical protein
VHEQVGQCITIRQDDVLTSADPDDEACRHGSLHVCRLAGRERSGELASGGAGAYNRSLCRSAPVLSHYPVIRLSGHRDCSSDDVPDIPAARFRSSPSCSRWAAGWPYSCLRPGRAAGSARTIPSRLQLRRWPSARRCRWDGRPTQPRCGSGGVVPQGFPMSPVRAWIRQSRSMCLPWTGDGPVIYPPYTCAGDMPGSPGREVRSCCCERGARPTGAVAVSTPTGPGVLRRN